MIAIRAAKDQGRKTVAFFRREAGITEFTEDLAFRTVIFVEIDRGRFAARAGTSFRNIAFLPAGDWFEEFSVALLPVRDQLFASPILFIRLDEGKLIHLELLVFGRMGIIKSPLLKRDMSADKVDQPAVLLRSIEKPGSK